MRKLKAVYITLLILVGILFGYTSLTITNQLAQSKESTVLVQKNELIDLGNRAVIQFRIINPAAQDKDYSYKILIDGSHVYNDKVSIPAGGYLLHPWNLYPTEEGKNEVNILVYEGDKPDLIENVTYYI